MTDPATRFKPRELALSAVVYLAALCAVAWWYIPELTKPLVGPGDTNQFEFASCHLTDHLRWLPWPRMQLFSNDVFYPYGVKHVFETWAFEQNFIVGYLWHWLGPGPWIKWYWLAGLFIGAWGTFALTRTRVGFVQAVTFGFMASFANFFFFYKYPDHMCYASGHWVTLAILTDSLLTRAVISEGRMPLRLVLLRGLLTVLCLGHDLAYAAAASLTSLVVHALWLPIYGRVRLALSKSAVERYREGSQALKAEIRRPSRTAWAMLVAIAFVAFCYVPLAAQISRAASDFPRRGDQNRLIELSGMEVAPTNPLRIFWPFFPGFNPAVPHFDFADEVERPGMGSVGWAFLAVAVSGLYCDRRHWPIYVPLVLLLLALVTFSPDFDWLRKLPWMQFTRVCGRGTVIYPAIFIAMGMGCVWQRPRRAWQWLAFAALYLTLAVEVVVGHGISDADSRRPSADQSFYEFMDVVKAAPGEAVLEWPFCVIGGSGSYNTLGGYYATNATTSSYQRFHGKKTMGHYFGRLLPTQVMPFVRAGWDVMLMPVEPSIYQPTHQQNAFTPTQWRFFTDFYRTNDFCGIILYPDRLAPGEEEEFYRRFGQPTARSATAWHGPMVFIPKPADERQFVDRDRGKTILLEEASVMQANGSYALSYDDPHVAIGWFEKGLALDPESWQCLAGIAEAYKLLNQPDKAEEYYRRATAMSQEEESESQESPP